ncbi:hypothetical protein Poli38472_010091 [Pythium oligandrum]|uniref:P21-activated protein kinase-interacting protein 1-like n=1 Tax=Pythium oligandrum TaxID=41045 RepID=A0A8K1FGB7_PYTOL|nr:hypothetical protein Poli38472_010091 [Pythium oligandrum]|eukprot:TMW58532.1 hypothetical protein Poli38472_010091 [Pythium oligandrum]
MIRIVAGTYEGLLYGWELPVTAKKPTKMKLTFGYSAHAECIKSVSLMTAKEGKTLISGGNDEMIKIYNVNKRVEVGTLMEHKGAVTCLEFFGQSHMLSGSADNSICIWRTSDWNCLHILGGHKAEITSMAVHPSGKLAFSVARDRTLRMWNLVKGRIAYIRRLEKEASSVVMSQSGSRYALSFGSDVSVFSSANAEVVGMLEHSDKVHAAVFATDEYVVCGGEDKCIYVWKATGSLVAKVTHADIISRIRCMEVVYARGAEELPWIVVASSSGAVQVWDLADFTFDDESPEEANKDVTPLVSTTLLSKPRVTCLSACVASSDDKDASGKAKTKKTVKKVKKVEVTKISAAESAAAPRVVVEIEDKTETVVKTTTTEKSNAPNKRKAKQQGQNGKKKKAAKQ